MKIRNALWLIFLIPCLSFGQENPVSFTVKNAGFNVHITFQDVASTLNYDSINISNSYFKVLIEVNSIESGMSSRDRHLKKEKYFDVENYPQIKFISTLVFKKQGKLFVQGDLTIKGVKKQIEFPFNYIGNEEMLIGEFIINRRDYGIGKASLLMANDVSIVLKFSLKKESP